jgi:hypothetical protein
MAGFNHGCPAPANVKLVTSWGSLSDYTHSLLGSKKQCPPSYNLISLI